MSHMLIIWLEQMPCLRSQRFICAWCSLLTVPSALLIATSWGRGATPWRLTCNIPVASSKPEYFSFFFFFKQLKERFWTLGLFKFLGLLPWAAFCKIIPPAPMLESPGIASQGCVVTGHRNSGSWVLLLRVALLSFVNLYFWRSDKWSISVGLRKHVCTPTIR